MSEEQSEYVGGLLLLIGFMHRLYEEYVGSSVLLLLKKKTDRRDIIAKLVDRSGSKLSDMDRSYTVKKRSSLKEEDDDDDEEPSISRPVSRRYGYGWGRQQQQRAGQLQLLPQS